MGAADLSGKAGIGAALGSVFPGFGNLVGYEIGSALDAKDKANNAKTNLRGIGEKDASQAAAIQQSLLQQPKITSPDDFLAQKNKAMMNLRLGIASTITGAGGAPPPILSAPTLTATGGGKTKLGA